MVIPCGTCGFLQAVQAKVPQIGIAICVMAESRGAVNGEDKVVGFHIISFISKRMLPVLNLSGHGFMW